MENKRRRVELIVEFLQTASLLYNRNYSKEELRSRTRRLYTHRWSYKTIKRNP